MKFKKRCEKCGEEFEFGANQAKPLTTKELDRELEALSDTYKICPNCVKDNELEVIGLLNLIDALRGKT